MTEIEALRGQVAVLRERIMKLSEASLRVGSSLEPGTVLREIAHSARALTGARYAAIATIDETGNPVKFVTSGFTEEEHRALTEWPDGPRLFEHLRDLEGPLRIDDVPDFVHSLGIPADLLPRGAFQGTPMRHQGEHVGNFYLAGKANDAAFTEEDEETLVLFASQAAAAIAITRTYCAEQQARAGLEALVETSPTGIVVIDGATGRVASLNREARRIAERLCPPGRPVEDLHEMLTCRFPNGYEFPLGKLPLEQVLHGGLTVRAEEIELSVPDGPSVKTLINAIPNEDGDSGHDSVVVTLQDLAPLNEMERMQTGFAAMVSHELRTPLTSIKGSTAALLGNQPFGMAERREFVRIIDEQADQMTRMISSLLDAGSIESGTLSVSPEPAELVLLIDRARNTFTSSGGRHPLRINVPPDLPLAMADRDRVVQVIVNLLVNAAQHSPESEPITIAAKYDNRLVEISVSDQGSGITPSRLPHLFSKGNISSHGGSGLGLAICKGLVEAHGGRIRAESSGAGQGSRLSFTLPAAGKAVVRALCADSLPDTETEPERILVVDNDPQSLRLMREALNNAGYAALITGEAQELGALIRKEKPALVVLDVVLRDTNGIELLRTLPELAQLPVIMISGYGSDTALARALEAGAADYIVKPFSPAELVARIGAVLRRHADPESFELNGLAIDYNRRRIAIDGEPVDLTPTEFNLLRTLSLNAGRVMSYDTLRLNIWGRRNKSGTEVVRAFVKQLRAKLGEDAAKPVWIFNQRGVGYRMPQPDEMPDS